MSSIADWPTCAEAAELLKTSVRSIQRRIASGEIESGLRQRIGKRPETVVDPAGLTRIAASWPDSRYSVSEPLTPGKREDARPGPRTDAQAIAYALAASAERIAAALEAANEKRPLWLTMQEATGFSGLNRQQLRRAIADGAVQRRGHKVRRADLEAL